MVYQSPFHHQSINHPSSSEDILCDALRGATAQWINMNLEEP